MKLKKILLVVSIFLVNWTYAQQPIFTQYYFNPIYTNPAFTGNAYCLSLKAQYRNMWTGFESSPISTLVTAHSPIGLSSSSLGISIYNDNFALTKNTGAIISYAYRFQTKIGRIVAGTHFNAENYKQSLTESKPYNSFDPALLSNVNKTIFNFGLGVAWENENGYVGIAVPKIIRNYLSETDSTSTSGTVVQMNVTGVYTIQLNSKWKITPSVLYKYVASTPSQLDMQVHLLFDEQVQFDAGFRSNSTYIAGVQYKLKNKFTFGYSYDYDNSSFGSTTGGSHEVLLGYDFYKPEGE